MRPFVLFLLISLIPLCFTAENPQCTPSKVDDVPKPVDYIFILDGSLGFNSKKWKYIVKTIVCELPSHPDIRIASVIGQRSKGDSVLSVGRMKALGRTKIINPHYMDSSDFVDRMPFVLEYTSESQCSTLENNLRRLPREADKDTYIVVPVDLQNDSKCDPFEMFSRFFNDPKIHLSAMNFEQSKDPRYAVSTSWDKVDVSDPNPAHAASMKDMKEWEDLLNQIGHFVAVSLGQKTTTSTTTTTTTTPIVQQRRIAKSILSTDNTTTTSSPTSDKLIYVPEANDSSADESSPEETEANEDKNEDSGEASQDKGTTVVEDSLTLPVDQDSVEKSATAASSEVVEMVIANAETTTPQATIVNDASTTTLEVMTNVVETTTESTTKESTTSTSTTTSSSTTTTTTPKKIPLKPVSPPEIIPRPRLHKFVTRAPPKTTTTTTTTKATRKPRKSRPPAAVWSSRPTSSTTETSITDSVSNNIWGIVILCVIILLIIILIIVCCIAGCMKRKRKIEKSEKGPRTPLLDHSKLEGALSSTETTASAESANGYENLALNSDAPLTGADESAAGPSKRVTPRQNVPSPTPGAVSYQPISVCKSYTSESEIPAPRISRPMRSQNIPELSID